MGSSADILYCDTFKKMGLKDSQLTLVDVPLVGFNGGTVYRMGSIALIDASVGWRKQDRQLRFYLLGG